MYVRPFTHNTGVAAQYANGIDGRTNDLRSPVGVANMAADAVCVTSVSLHSFHARSLSLESMTRAPKREDQAFRSPFMSVPLR